MAIPKTPSNLSPGNPESLGLLANGSSGPWDIDIDGSLSGPERWFAAIEGPAVSILFEIPSLGIVDQVLRFLERPPGMEKGAVNDSLVIGNDKNPLVTLVKDDEYEDRFFLVVGPMAGTTVRFALTGPDAGKIVEALRQVKEDLEDN